MNENQSLTEDGAGALLQSALAAGVEWVGVHVQSGRPLLGCDPDNTPASQALNDLRGAYTRDRKLMDRALWNYVMDQSPEWRDDLAVVQRMGVAHAH